MPEHFKVVCFESCEGLLEKKRVLKDAATECGSLQPGVIASVDAGCGQHVRQACVRTTRAMCACATPARISAIAARSSGAGSKLVTPGHGASSNEFDASACSS